MSEEAELCWVCGEFHEGLSEWSEFSMHHGFRDHNDEVPMPNANLDRGFRTFNFHEASDKVITMVMFCLASSRLAGEMENTPPTEWERQVYEHLFNYVSQLEKRLEELETFIHRPEWDELKREVDQAGEATVLDALKQLALNVAQPT